MRAIIQIHNGTTRTQLENFLGRDSIIKSWKHFPNLYWIDISESRITTLQRSGLIKDIIENKQVHLQDIESVFLVGFNGIADADMPAVRNRLAELGFETTQHVSRPGSIWFEATNDQVEIVRNDSTLVGLGYSDVKIMDDPLTSLRVIHGTRRAIPSHLRELVNPRNAAEISDIRFTSKGAGTFIYVVDTGIFLDHDEFRYQSKMENGTADPSQGIINTLRRYDRFRNAHRDFSEQNHPDSGLPDYGVIEYTDANGLLRQAIESHGTHVASCLVSTTYGVAPEALLIPVRIFDARNEATVCDLLDAFNWILTDYEQNGNGKPHIVNMSLGMESLGANGCVIDAIEAMIQAGLTVVVSAGNYGTDAFELSPANVGVERIDGEYIIDEQKKPLVVGSHVRTNAGEYRIAGFSNYGPVVDIYAPGRNVECASMSYSKVGVNVSHTSYTTKSAGTSLSAPMVAGIAALYLSHFPTWTHQDVKQAITQNSIVGTLSSDSVVRGGLTSHNRIAHAYFVETSLEWNGQFQMDVEEEYNHLLRIQAGTYTRYKVYQPTKLRVEPIGTLPNGISWSDFTQIEDVQQTTNLSQLSVYFNVPAVSNHQEVKLLAIADDGRFTRTKVIKFDVKNLPKPPVWISPAPGPFLPAPVRRDDILDQSSAEFLATQEDGWPVTYRIIPGDFALPRSLMMKQGFNSYGQAVAYLEGLVRALPRSSSMLEYDFMIRAITVDPDTQMQLVADRRFVLQAEYQNEPHFFTPIWLSSLGTVTSPGDPNHPIYRVSRAAIGNSYGFLFGITNPDNDLLSYAVTPVPGISSGPDVFNGFLPAGLEIVARENAIRGIVDHNTNESDFYFRVTASDPDGVQVYADFCMEVRKSSTEVATSEEIEWVTPPGNIGHVYESFPSHCQVVARAPSGGSITYELVQGGGILPDGFILDPTTGYIYGTASFVESDITYTFTVRAILGSRFVDRVFSITIVDLYVDPAVMNVHVNLMGFERERLESWLTNESLFNESELFRPMDPKFGVTKSPHMYVLNGLNASMGDPDIMNLLQDYHHRMDLRFSRLRWAMARDASGAYVYDVVYIEVIDPQHGAGGFEKDENDNTIEVRLETIHMHMSEKQGLDYPDWDAQSNPVVRFYPNSLENVRNDFIQTSDRVGDPGPGLNGREGLPMWMRTQQTIGSFRGTYGFIPALVVAYAKPGAGAGMVARLISAGFQNEFTGKTFTVDRYFISKLDSRVTTTFTDIPVTGGLAAPTTFDDPDGEVYIWSYDINTDTWSIAGNPSWDPSQGVDGLYLGGLVLDPWKPTNGDPLITTQPTQFDYDTVEVGKYYKFPRDDKDIFKMLDSDPDYAGPSQ